MSIFKLVRAPAEEAISIVMKQKGEMEDMKSKTQGYVPKVMGAWRGGDEQEFEDDLNRKLVPAIANLMAAIQGFGGNLGSVMNIFDSADSKVTSMVGGLSDMFGSFLK